MSDTDRPSISTLTDSQKLSEILKLARDLADATLDNHNRLVEIEAKLKFAAARIQIVEEDLKTVERRTERTAEAIVAMRDQVQTLHERWIEEASHSRESIRALQDAEEERQRHAGGNAGGG